MPVTFLVASLAAIALVALGVAVSLRRGQVGPEIGFGSDEVLLRRIRAHGNFTEYVPLGLVVLGLAESAQTAAPWLWTVAGLLVLGRVLHATGILTGWTPVRATGMLATHAALVAGAAALLFHLVTFM